MEKDSAIKKRVKGRAGVVNFRDAALRGTKMGVPPQKFSIFFPEICCQCIDRKSQKVSATYVKPLGRDRR